MHQQNSITLDYVKDATAEARTGLIRYLEHRLGPRFSCEALLFAFEGCALPMSRFISYTAGDDLPAWLHDDIATWLFMRVVGRKPKRNALQQIDPKEAMIFATTITHPDWRDKARDPLALGYLPY
jgi:transcriptional regulator of met regulon